MDEKERWNKKQGRMIGSGIRKRNGIVAFSILGGTFVSSKSLALK
jgi:hypothetical protein